MRVAGTQDRRELERAGREAGRRAQVETVSAFLNQPIDHLMEISLIGFFHIAEGLGGVDVCLKNATEDPLSGADFPAGPQHLAAVRALVDMAKQDVVLDARFDLTEFASRLPAEVRFDTLPIEGGATLGGLDVNRVDRDRVRARVRELATAPPPPPPNDGIPCVD